MTRSITERLEDGRWRWEIPGMADGVEDTQEAAMRAIQARLTVWYRIPRKPGAPDVHVAAVITVPGERRVGIRYQHRGHTIERRVRPYTLTPR